MDVYQGFFNFIVLFVSISLFSLVLSRRVRNREKQGISGGSFAGKRAGQARGQQHHVALKDTS
jgi:hypothetical protein